MKLKLDRKPHIYIFIIITTLMLSLAGCGKENKLELSGTIESTQIDCNSEVAGKVTRLEKEEGSMVKAGDVVVVVDSSLQELTVKQQEAVIKLKQAKLDELKAGTRPEQKGSTSQTIKAAEADLEQSNIALEQTKLVLSKYQVKAPSDGTLLMRNVELGDMVNTGTNIATISNLADLWIKVYIQQRQLKNISLGQELDLYVSALDKTIKGKITYIADQAEYTPKNVETDDAKENTVFKVKIKILYSIDRLKPGMTATAIIPLEG